jgi:anti-sigma factor RsiW
MSDANNITPFSPEDILRYQQGLLSPKERNAMEKAALEDPFLADALEGYAATGASATDMQDLQQRLKTRVESGKVLHMDSGRSGFPWLRVAAAVLILAGAGIPAYIFLSWQRTK